MARTLRHRGCDVMPKENDQYINDPPAKLAITVKVEALNLIHDWAMSRHHELTKVTGP